MGNLLTRGGLALGLCAGVVLFAGGCNTTEPVAENKVNGIEPSPMKAGKADGQGTPVPTKITAPDMDCPSCAKKVIAKLNAVPGVERVEPDFEAHTLTIIPKAGEVPSPKSLWEACVAGGQDPTKLEGPSGVFTSAPTQ